MTGVSSIEIILALALVMIVVTGALQAQFISDYWALTSQLSTEALSLVAEQEGVVRSIAKQDFYRVTSTALRVVTSTTNPLVASCGSGGLCYSLQQDVIDISSCAKVITTRASWQLGGYVATSSVARTSQKYNPAELINRGGDCPLDAFPGGWEELSPTRQVAVVATSTFVTGIDVFNDRMYLVASSAPQFRIYARSDESAVAPTLLATSSVLGNRLNAIDVVRDATSGRVYAYVVQHTKTDQLVVLDVTNDAPTIVAVRSLVGTDAAGSFPQGWRVVSYGKRLYVTTRETAGAELHIFNNANSSNPIEISTGAVNLARTVNDMTVREQRVSGVTRRYLFLAASAALKELALFEVTNDVPVERVALNLPGTENALSLFINGDALYLGRGQSVSGPELYQYRVSALLAGSTTPLATSEVGADIHTLQGAALVLLLGTNRSGAELQTWHTDAGSWNPSVSNAGRIGVGAAPRLAPQGIDSDGVILSTFTQSFTQPEQVILWSVP